MPDIHSGLIKIVKAPREGAPEHIRKAWIGLRLPCMPMLDFYPSPDEVLNPPGKCGSEKCSCATCKTRSGGYVALVPSAEALEILGAHSPEAADWWKQNHSWSEGVFYFNFNLEDIEILNDSVEWPFIRECPVEAQGNLGR